MLPVEIWISIIRELNYTDAISLGESCEYAKDIIREHGLLEEKLLNIRITSHLSWRNMFFEYKGERVGFWYNCTSELFLTIQLSRIRELSMVEKFKKIKGRIRKVVVITEVSFFMDILAFLSVLEAIGINQSVKELQLIREGKCYRKGPRRVWGSTYVIENSGTRVRARESNWFYHNSRGDISRIFKTN